MAADGSRVGRLIRGLRNHAHNARGKFRLLRAWVWWDVWGRDLVVLIAIGLSLWSSILTQRTLHRQDQEGRERRDQNCLIFERAEQRAVTTLARTYQYLAGLTAKQLTEPLNQAVLAGLPSTISDAQTTDAPPYCNDPGVGLPEPGPKFPAPPKNLPQVPHSH